MEHASPKSTISVAQQSSAPRPSDLATVLQPVPPQVPHSATQHALPLEDWMPAMPAAASHTAPVDHIEAGQEHYAQQQK